MFNRKVVEFEINGETKYALRRWTLCGFQYKDFKHAYWWNMSDEYFKHCLGTKEQVMRHILHSKNVMSPSAFMKKHMRTEDDKLEDDKLDRLGVNHE